MSRPRRSNRLVNRHVAELRGVVAGLEEEYARLTGRAAPATPGAVERSADLPQAPRGKLSVEEAENLLLQAWEDEIESEWQEVERAIDAEIDAIDGDADLDDHELDEEINLDAELDDDDLDAENLDEE